MRVRRIGPARGWVQGGGGGGGGVSIAGYGSDTLSYGPTLCDEYMYRTHRRLGTKEGPKWHRRQTVCICGRVPLCFDFCVYLMADVHTEMG